MAKWEITLPYRDRDAKLDPAAIADDAAESIADPEEQAVVRALGMELFLDPHLETVGDALDALEAASPAARRALLDKARQQAGLPTTGEQDADDAYRDANRNRGGGSLRDSQGRVEARCSAPGCSRYEPDRRFPAVAGEPGLAVKVNVRKWWCSEHRAGHEADMGPYTGPRLGYSLSGAIVDLDELEVERQRAETVAETRQRRRDAQQAERRADGEKLRELERLRDERMRREHIPIPGRKP